MFRTVAELRVRLLLYFSNANRCNLFHASAVRAVGTRLRLGKALMAAESLRVASSFAPSVNFSKVPINADGLRNI
jgi:hypothetical protein